MRAYSLSKAFFDEQKKARILFHLPYVLGFIAVAVIVITYNGVTAAAIATAVVILIVVLIYYWNSYRLDRKGFESYRVILEEDAIRRVKAGVPDVTINRRDIARISGEVGKGIKIDVVNSDIKLGIPATLDGFEEVRERLSSWAPIQSISSPQVNWRALVSQVVIVGSLLTVGIQGISRNKVVVLALGGLLLVVWSVFTVIILRSPAVLKREKWAFWLIVLLLFITAMRMIYAVQNLP